MDLRACSRRSATRPDSRCIGSSPGRPAPRQRPSWPTRSACTPTRSGSTSTGSGRPASSRSRPVHRGTVGRPQHLYSLAPGRARSGLRSARTRLLAGLLAALAETGRRRRRRGHARPAARGAPRPASAPATAALSEGAGAGARPPRVRARVGPRRDAGRRRPGSRSCTARSASWPRPTRSWSATCTAASVKDVGEAGGGTVRAVLDVVRP